MKVLISGGGTGGHIYPGLAIARGLEEEFDDLEIIFVGTERGLEADIIPKAGYDLKTISVQGLPRKLSLKLFKSILKTGVGLIEARKIVKEFKPDIVIGTGGYVCGPIVLAAALSKVPTLIHEQNAYPGITNKLLSRFVDKIALSNIDAQKYFKSKEKTILTGNPIRPEILKKDRNEALAELGIAEGKKIILVFGGSRGARSINQAVIGLYPKIKRSNLQLLHITGKQDFDFVIEKAKEMGINDVERGNIMVKPYLYNMAAALAVANLVISRAGATGLAEITACGIPAILIPYPYASENHQLHNAQSLEKKGAAKVILDDKLTTEILNELISDLFTHEEKLIKMAKASGELGQPQAIEKLINLIKDLIRV
ncbi:undecaprenyldiphospho-muramoylpentapeptide beta-N-acetylglucosaminyltransferase [Orenia metallireducens]|uniref:UDP-N-acetylglucosamine--N-acetylmuramyl-(pentapeptide) pyrophosphoryl-undecaprenol N-acetylglucosamine transferase n=1 Tax=Orenia metallireducens TaxID=1413210 RepID=A0A1C0ACL3_9FIRM|nr:undecaprenyldiphospho-muramoylpentapeptide beta-N-acetylglucosaminyltransferase [Orenia metallireducens]OCL28122.1 undecaprenyldiphospho-muramoylpentapeptide beta-N-acetylglucosaminyltransferase [Orenia metallireducens]